MRGEACISTTHTHASEKRKWNIHVKIESPENCEGNGWHYFTPAPGKCSSLSGLSCVAQLQYVLQEKKRSRYQRIPCIKTISYTSLVILK